METFAYSDNVISSLPRIILALHVVWLLYDGAGYYDMKNGKPLALIKAYVLTVILLATIEQGKVNGATGLRMVEEEELRQLVPASVNRFAMFSENSGVVDPFIYTIALAENAVMNGVEYFLGHEVIAIDWKEDHYEVTASAMNHSEKLGSDNRVEMAGTNNEMEMTESDRKAEMTESDNKGEKIFCTRWVINSAGLGCGEISEMLGIHGYHVIGSKGDYIILDQRTGALLPMPIYPVPSNLYMGIHVTNTTDGNVIVGPNAITLEDHKEFSYYGVPKENMDYLAQSASDIWPHIKKADYIRNYWWWSCRTCRCRKII